MNQKTRHWCEVLAESCDLKTEQDFADYSKAIGILSQSDDVEALRCMIRCLRDVEGGEVQYELVEGCEKFPDEAIYVKTLLEEGEAMLGKSPQWFGLMLQSAMNSSSCVQSLAALKPQMSDGQRRFLAAFLTKLSRGNDKYRAVLARVT